MKPITYHCPHCKVAITTAMLKLTRTNERNKRDGYAVWDTIETATYAGSCYNCGEPLRIDKNSINGQYEDLS